MEVPYKVTLAVFSGRPDPEWTVHPNHESHKEITERLATARASKDTYRQEHMPSRLGFKGFLLHHDETEPPELLVGQKTKHLQKLLHDTIPHDLIPGDLLQQILQIITSEDTSEEVKKPAPTVDMSPDLNLDRWNTDPYITMNNNCYNYGNNKITNTFAQPGRGSNHPFNELTAKQVEVASEFDGLVPLQPQPKPEDPVPPAPSGDSCLVALVVAEGIDYHWYRLDSNGRWSHKPGNTKATIYDGDGNLIYDPRTAANSIIPYKFVAFMTTDPAIVKIE